jgi:hypothetical protein
MFAAVAYSAEHGRNVVIGKMMEEMIGESIIDRKAQPADVACVGLNEADRLLASTGRARVAQNARVVVEAIYRAANPKTAALPGKPNSRIAPARGNIEEAHFPSAAPAHVRNHRPAQDTPDLGEKTVDIFKITQCGKKHRFIGRSIVHQLG